MSEKKNRKKIELSVSERLWVRLRFQAMQESVSVNALATKIITEHMDRVAPLPPPQRPHGSGDKGEGDAAPQDGSENAAKTP